MFSINKIREHLLGKRYPKLAVCPVCKGTGADPMSDVTNWLPCTRCKGNKTI